MPNTKKLLALIAALLFSFPVLASNGGGGTTPLGPPTTSTLGGIFAKASATTHQVVQYIDTTGHQILVQLGAADISGLAASATTDTTNASNISSGTLAAARVATLNQNTTGNAATATLAATVTTNANLTGDVTSTGNTTSLAATTVTGKALTGFVSGSGTITAADTILSAIDKLNGNITGFVVNLATGISGTLGVSNGGTGAASSWLAMTNLTGNQYVIANGNSSNIQTAANALVTQFEGTGAWGKLVLSPGSVYTIGTPLLIEGDMMEFDCQGSILNDTTMANNGIAVSFQNLQGFGRTQVVGGRFHDCQIEETSGTQLTNGKTNYLVGGTPTALPTLSTSITSSSSSIVVSSISNLPTNGNFSVLIDNEYILVAPASSTTLTVVSRGWLATTAASHTSGVTVASRHSLSAQTQNVYSLGAAFNFNLAAGSWLANFDHIHSAFGKYCFYSNAAGLSAAGGENASITGSSVMDSCNNNMDLTSTIVRAENLSLDYFYNDSAGSGSISHQIAVHSGANFVCTNCHYEWNYGQNSGETNSPFALTDANSTMVLNTGKMFYAGSGARNWVAPFSSDNSSQNIILKDLLLSSVSSNIGLTQDDAWVVSSPVDTTDQTQTAMFHADNLISGSNSNADMPAANGLAAGTNWLRNGAGNAYGEFVSSGRTKTTGTIALSTQSGSDGTVIPRTGSGQSMMKITGNGNVIITFPNYGTYKRLAWGFYLNAAEISAGTVTVKVLRQSFNPAWDGSSTILFSSDARASTSSVYTFPSVGSNLWSMVSWKQMGDMLFPQSNYDGAYWSIVITLAGTTGNLYLDNAFFGVQ